jgi:hypothetical protein
MWNNQTMFGRDIIAQCFGDYVLKSPERGWLYVAFEDAAHLDFVSEWKNVSILPVTDIEGCSVALEMMKFNCGDIEETPQLNRLRERYKLALS